MPPPPPSRRANSPYRPLAKLATWESDAIVNFVGRGFVQRSDLVADVLAEARGLAHAGRVGAELDDLLARARELIGELDGMLRVLDPERNRYQFATIRTLRKELTRIEATRRALRTATAKSARIR